MSCTKASLSLGTWTKPSAPYFFQPAWLQIAPHIITRHTRLSIRMSCLHGLDKTPTHPQNPITQRDKKIHSTSQRPFTNYIITLIESTEKVSTQQSKTLRRYRFSGSLLSHLFPFHRLFAIAPEIVWCIPRMIDVTLRRHRFGGTHNA